MSRIRDQASSVPAEVAISSTPSAWSPKVAQPRPVLACGGPAGVLDGAQICMVFAGGGGLGEPRTAGGIRLSGRRHRPARGGAAVPWPTLLGMAPCRPGRQHGGDATPHVQGLAARIASGRYCVAFDPGARRGVVLRAGQGLRQVGAITLRTLAALVRLGVAVLVGRAGGWLVFSHPAHSGRWAAA